MTPHEHRELIKSRILGSYDNDIIKSEGEGSRGGHVIGHTKSGKPVYDSHDHERHQGFAYDDHYDAFLLHQETIAKNHKNAIKHGKKWGSQ